MALPTVSNTFAYLVAHGYPIIFLLMVLEGPVVTFVAAFAASLGYFNPSFVLLLSVLGNFLPDLVYYSVGRGMRERGIISYLTRKGVNRKSISRIETGLRRNAGKMMLAVKIIPPLPPIGLMLAGVVLPFKKFVSLSILISIGYSVLFFLAGFYSGKAYASWLHYLGLGQLALVLATIFSLVLIILIKKWLRKKASRFEGVRDSL